MKKIFWDSCVLIYRIQRVSPWAEIIQEKFSPVASAVRLYTTHLVRLECRVLPLREGSLDLLAQYDDFFLQSEVEIVPLDSEVINLATTLRARHLLKTPDALHLAAAISSGCDEFWSNDDRLLKVAENQIKIVDITALSEK